MDPDGHSQKRFLMGAAEVVRAKADWTVLFDLSPERLTPERWRSYEEGGIAGCDAQGRMLIFTEGAAADYSEEEATKLLKREKVTILAQFHMGSETATAWGCDLTYDYVKINADYRS